MELIRFRAKGWIGFARDMQVDEVEIDFSERRGLVALTGENGMGKSTLLELLSPHRGFISRKGAFNAHVQTRDAFKELTVRIEGELYTFMVKVDAGSSRAEGYVHRGDVPLVNGKLGDYDRKVEELFGSAELFYNSVFAAQRGGKKLNELPPGEIKELFVEFLQLHRYQVYEERAKGVRNLLAEAVDALEATCGAFHPEKEGLVAAERLSGVEREIAGTESEQGNVREAIQAGEANVEAIAGKVTGDEANRRAHADLAARLAEEEIALADARAAATEASARLETEQRGIGDLACVTRELGNIEQALPEMREQLLAMSGAISRQQELEEKEAHLRAQIGQSPLAELEAGHRSRMAGMEERHARLQDDAAALNRQEKALGLAMEGARLEFAALEERQDSLGTQKARAAEALDRAKAAHEEIRNGHGALQARIDALTAYKGETVALRETYATLRGQEAAASAERFVKQGLFDTLLREKEVCLAQQAGLDGIDPDCSSTVCRFITDARRAHSHLEEVVAHMATLQDEKEAFEEDRRQRVAEIRGEMARIQEMGQTRGAHEQSEEGSIRSEQEALARRQREAALQQEEAEAASQKLLGEQERLQRLREDCQAVLNRGGELESLTARSTEKAGEVAAMAAAMEEARGAFRKAWERAESERDYLVGQLKTVTEQRDPGIQASCDAARKRVRDSEERLEVLRAQKGRLGQIGHEMALLSQQVRKAQEERLPRMEKLSREMEALEQAFDPTLALSLRSERNRLAELRAKRDGIGEALRRLTGDRERAKAEVERLSHQDAERKAVQAQLVTARQEFAEWEQLRHFVSKDGLQVLEIDAASPLIEEYTNDLLEHAFGGMFAIEIVTQDPESGAEVFKIMVTRNDDGTVSDLKNLSGGQQVWVLKALRLGLSMLSREMSGKVIQTAFSDEEEAALDAKKSEAYVRLYRAFLTVGGFTSCLLVTHKETIMAMCDHRLHLQPGGPVWM